mgnify:CR=1 FL=1
MKAKKRLNRKDPSYFIPLSYAMAIKRLVTAEEMGDHLFERMRLSLNAEGVINILINVTAYCLGEDHIISLIPNGMISPVQGLMEHDDQVSIMLEREFCDQLKNMFWTSFDELSELKDLGFS